MPSVNRQTYVFNSDNSKMSTFGERLREARKEKSMSQGALAKLVGVKQPTIAELEAEGKGSSKASLIAKALGVNPIWLSEGKGNKYDTSYSVQQDLPSHQNEDVIKIPLLAAVGSMGNGNHNQDADFVLDALSITKTWLSKTFPSVMDTNKLRFIHAMGDSISPTFNDGDILLVDTGINDASIDSIYALEAHDRLFIKRVRRRLDGKFEISSDNPSVKTTDILNGDNEVLIKGRVIWVWNGRRI